VVKTQEELASYARFFVAQALQAAPDVRAQAQALPVLVLLALQRLLLGLLLQLLPLGLLLPPVAARALKQKGSSLALRQKKVELRAPPAKQSVSPTPSLLHVCISAAVLSCAEPLATLQEEDT